MRSPIHNRRSAAAAFMATVRDCGMGLLLATVAAVGLPDSARAQDRTGTGFFINEGGWILTNDHVVAGCNSISVDGLGTVRTVIRDDRSDLAVIHAGRSAPAAPLALRDRPARLAEDVVALGYPLSDLLSESVKATTGSVSSLAGVGHDETAIQISAPVQPGNSGGPVIDRSGHVIGVVKSRLSERAYSGAQNVNFALTVAEVLRFLGENGISYHLADTPGQARDRSDHVETAAAATVMIRCSGAARRAPSPGVARSVPPSAPQMTVAYGYDVLGFDYRTIRDTSALSCRLACMGDPACVAFTFNQRHDICFLKDNAMLLLRNGDAIGGYAPHLEGAVLRSSFSVSANMDAPGGDYARLRDTGFVECYLECELDGRCRGFAYVRATRDCWLKDHIGPTGHKRGVELGIR